MKELAEVLKEERLRQGLSLEDVSKRVHISINVLQVLEEGDFDRIGAAILIRGFVRAYCSALGMDPAPLMERFGVQIQACDRQDEGIRNYGVWSRSYQVKRRIWLIVVFVLLLLVAAAVYGVNLIAERRARLAAAPSSATDVYPQQELPSDLPERKPAESEGTAMKPVQPVQPVPVVAAAPASRPGEVLPEERAAASAERAQKQRLMAVASEKAWIQVRLDGKRAQNVMMQPREKREWEVEKDIQVTLEKSSAIRLSWNGLPVNTPADSKRIVRLRLPDPKLVPGPGKNPAQ